MQIEHLISQAIKAIREEKEKKIKAKVGRGNLKTYIKEGKSRAENDPDGLMKDLGISPQFNVESKIVSLSFREKVAALLRRSFEKNPAMSQAFMGVTYQEGRPEAQVMINSRLIAARDAAMFVNNILRAAQNSDLIQLSEDIEITPSGNEQVSILFIKS